MVYWVVLTMRRLSSPQRFLALLFCLAIGCSVFFGVSAATVDEVATLNKQIEERKAKIREIEKSIEEYKQKISQKRLEAASFSNQISILGNRIKQVELDIEATEEKLAELELEIALLKTSIEQKEQIITRERIMIQRLIRLLHQENSRGYIEILLAYDSFSDFYNHVQHVSTVEQDLGTHIRDLRLATEDLAKKKQQSQERHLAYTDLKAKLAQKKVDLGEQIAYKDTLLVQTKASEATYNTLLTNLRKQYQAIEGEIAGIEKEVRQRLAEEEKFRNLVQSGGSKLSWPSQSRYITAYFHDPDYPFRTVFEHNAVDIRASHGTPIKAASSGYVARAKKCSTASCYAYVMIVHANGISTVYGHLSRITAEEEQFVAVGDVIGYSGGTPGTVGAGPFVTGAHLHFEVRKNGIPVNPLDYLP